MTITPQQLIALLPLLIVGLTVVVVMLSIAWRRNHFLNATLSVLGLNAALVSLWFVGQNGAMDVTPLIRVDGYAMLYTGLVLLASLATCTFAYPWLEGYKDNKEEFYLLVLIAALGGILLAGANHLAALFLGIELISLPLFGLGWLRLPPEAFAGSEHQIHHPLRGSFVLPAVRYGAGVCELRQPVLPRAGQKPGGQHAARAAAAGGSWPDDCRSWL